MKTATRYLEKRMVRDLEIATAGRYRHVRIDDKTLDIEVRAPEKHDWVKVTALSQGTLDLVYLTARLGLVRLVTGDRRPPLIFDDPFVTLDDERATRALELLRGVTTDFQVIYLTTSDRYDSGADAIVELPGPTADDDAPPPTVRRPDRLRAGLEPGGRHHRPRARLGALVGRRRLRWWSDEPSDRGLRRRPHLAGDRDGDRARARHRAASRCRAAADIGWSLLGGVARRGRDHGAVPGSRRRADGDRRAGHRACSPRSSRSPRASSSRACRRPVVLLGIVDRARRRRCW